MRLPIRRWVAALSVAMAGAASAAPPAGVSEIWPREVSPASLSALASQQAKIDTLAKALPTDLTPAARYQKTFLSILDGAPESTWSDEVTRLAAAPGEDGMTRGLREVGKYWLARLEMKQIGEALSGFYVHEIRFPEKFSLIEPDLPANIRRDPWGEPWVYQLIAPDQFRSLDGQGYRLGPTRFPGLTLLRQVQRPRKVAIPGWNIKAVNAGGRPALEFRSAASTALIQPGGVADGCTLLYIGEGWALLAQVDQLFTVSF